MIADKFVDLHARNAGLRDGRYDWEDLHRLLRANARPDPEEVLRAVETRFAVLRSLSALESKVVADARSGRNEPLAERLRSEIRSRFTATGSGPLAEA